MGKRVFKRVRRRREKEAHYFAVKNGIAKVAQEKKEKDCRGLGNKLIGEVGGCRLRSSAAAHCSKRKC